MAIGRAMFRNPYWAFEAASKLNKKTQVPKQYGRGFSRSIQEE